MGDGKIRVRIWPKVAQEGPRGSLSLGLRVWVPGSWNWAQDKSSKQNESREERGWELTGLFYQVSSVPVKCIKFQSQLQVDWLEETPQHFFSGNTYFVVVVVFHTLHHVWPFCDPMNCNLPDSSVHGILQARILEWLPLPSPGDLPNPGMDPSSPTGGYFTNEPQGKPKSMYFNQGQTYFIPQIKDFICRTTGLLVWTRQSRYKELDTCLYLDRKRVSTVKRPKFLEEAMWLEEIPMREKRE